MRLHAVLAVAFCAVQGFAQQWVILDGPCLAGRGIAYDSRRGRAVVFGSEGETWEFEGTTRLHRPATAGPFARTSHIMVYDQARGQTLLFGGRTNLLSLGDTWLWDGSTWQQPFSAVTPPRRVDAAIAYDSVRSRVILFGGQDPFNTTHTDTWEWDGSQWLQRTPSTIPPFNYGQMAFDSARNVTVLVLQSGGPLAVFEWNGTDWTQRTSTTPAPGQRQNYSACYDPLRQRTVLFGGSSNDLWEWDGAAWQLRLASAPITAINPGMYFDPVRGAVVIMGDEQGIHTSMWSWDGTTFANVATNHSPSSRFNYAMYHDTARNRTVMFGGFFQPGERNDTWEWDGLRWTQRTPATSPPARQGAMACFDPVTATGLLFGGAANGPTFFSDCWRYDGTNWTQLPGPVPTTRNEGAMAWDPVRNEAILFGGMRSSTWLGDTWRFNGTAWTQVATATAPQPRIRHGMAFNPLSSRIVLFGGTANGVTNAHLLNDTWEWDGAQWQRILTPQSPPPLAGTMVHDPVRAKMLLVAPLFVSQTQRDLHVWEYDGVIWTQVMNTPGTTSEATQLVWDQQRQRPIMYTSRFMRELTSTPASADPLGSGCGAPPPLLAARARPRTGENLFGLELSSRPNLPVVFVLGFGLGSTPIGNGCTLLVQQMVATPFVLAGGNGLSVLPVLLPPNHALRGLVVHTQALALDPAAAGGLALSAGLRLIVGD